MMWPGQFEVKFFEKALIIKKTVALFYGKKSFHFDDKNCNFRIKPNLETTTNFIRLISFIRLKLIKMVLFFY